MIIFNNINYLIIINNNKNTVDMLGKALGA